MEPKTAVNPGLGDDLVMEVGPSSTSENPCKAVRSILAVEVAIPVTSTLLAVVGNALALVRGEDAHSAAPSFAGPSEEITGVGGVLKDWSSNVITLYYISFFESCIAANVSAPYFGNTLTIWQRGLWETAFT